MLAAALTLIAALAAGAPTPPAPTRWVTDQAGFLSPQARQALDARLESYDHATGHQVIVWIDRTLAGAALDEWAVRTFEAWKPGRKGKDDGLAVFVLSDDRKIDIEVGYGLEDKVPDVVASRIIREVMAPRLRAGDRDGAVTAGVDAVLAAIEGKPWAGAPVSSTEPARPSWLNWGGIGLIVLALIFFLINPRAASWFFWALLASGRGRNGGWGGGGGGGFSGGGGRSGGGGARGGW